MRLLRPEMYGGALGGSSSDTQKRGYALTATLSIILFSMITSWLVSCRQGLEAKTPIKKRYDNVFDYGNDDLLIVSIAFAYLLAIVCIVTLAVDYGVARSRGRMGRF